MAKMIKVTLTKSVIGASPNKKKVVEALGITKMNQSVELVDSPVTRGAVSYTHLRSKSPGNQNSPRYDAERV